MSFANDKPAFENTRSQGTEDLTTQHFSLTIVLKFG